MGFWRWSLHLGGVLAIGLLGYWVGQRLTSFSTGAQGLRLSYVLPLVGGGLGFLAVDLLAAAYGRLRRWLGQMPARRLVAGTAGLMVGLALSALLAFPLSLLPAPWGWTLPPVAAALLGYAGAAVMLMREAELAELLAGRSSADPRPTLAGTERALLDTSAIIDGRIGDISQTGFIRGTLVVPRFVLDELRHIADSSDILRRNRGRRGLDVLHRLQRESLVSVSIADEDVSGAYEVDTKLVELARKLGCPIITNDFNLNRVAELQGVRVLNINELANAVKAVLLPGEELDVHIIQEGKEVGQGVGFLDDGTMVVVEGGRRYLDDEIEVVVTRSLQTAAGRMIFAQPKVEPEDVSASMGGPRRAG